MSQNPGGYSYPSDDSAAASDRGRGRGRDRDETRSIGYRYSIEQQKQHQHQQQQQQQQFNQSTVSFSSRSSRSPPSQPQSQSPSPSPPRRSLPLHLQSATTVDPALSYRPSSAASSSSAATTSSSFSIGSKRKKMFGYLKAANELRQNYSAQLMHKLNGDGTTSGDFSLTGNNASGSSSSSSSGGSNLPLNFTDPMFTPQGDEQMVLFPTYAKRHRRRRPRDSPTIQRYVDQALDEHSAQAQQELARWRAEWERYDNDRAVVDVDVRGWIFAPQRGQLNRKSRLLVGLAKRLSGIPSQPVRPASWNEGEVLFNADGSPHDVAYGGGGGGETEGSGRGSASSGSSNGRGASPGRNQYQRNRDVPYSTQEEIDKANEELMERLNPLLTNPLVEVPITIFFYNSTHSQSRTVTTNDGGHFFIRVSLDFVPTQIRVLALEDLSQTDTVNIIEEEGISLVSDIDDTVKHTGINQGAKEIFRNTFVRRPETLTINGVNEWYQDLVRRGVKMHYVSNSPWQLYPQIELFFVLAGLPSGSFHLKRYSGLQEFFEPTVEKKRGALEMLLRDFPARKFILVGDSGESDLEAYTELVLSHPGRILGIFIRDITTPMRPQQYQQQQQQLAQRRFRERSDSDVLPQRNRFANAAMFSDTNLIRNRPPIPPRQQQQQQQQNRFIPSPEPVIGDLIDLSLDDDDQPAQRPSASTVPPPSKAKPPPPKRKPVPPSLPAKPKNLRGAPSVPDLRKVAGATTSSSTAGVESSGLKAEPFTTNNNNSSSTSVNRYNNIVDVPYPPPPRKAGNGNGNGNGSTTTLNGPSRPSGTTPTSASSSSSSSSSQQQQQPQPPPVPPPRRRATATEPANMQDEADISNTPARRPQLPVRPQHHTTLPSLPPPPQRLQQFNHSVSNAVHSSGLPTSLTSLPSLPSLPVPGQIPTKQEEAWQRRWEKAQEIMRRQNVVLVSWRGGEDVREMCVKMVERERGRGGGEGSRRR